ncbi:MAG TPA: D-alanyl-D-alanine carboxypeptidase/D-alanyl-D-alanine-endopeptidase, partial [Thermoanaerobaculia bacterium]|nr:D-alanyl-D-alanine carboxypeptidase/D-alanyl-D-alanine-endopeptidase [Thermoanaerobaculia bacterium]
MILRPTRALAVAVSILAAVLVSPSTAHSATKKKKPARKPAPTRRAAAPPLDTASGGTLQERLASLVNGSVARSSDASIQIVELESGSVLAERNPHQPLAPASNMKLFTTGAAIDLLKPSFEVTTAVFVRGNVRPDGTLDGDVKVVGRGDPTIGGRFHDGRATAVIDEWTSDLKRAGVKTVSGNLIFEYGYFDTEYIHPTWPVDQLVNWYEAPVSSFSMQEGCVQVRVMPSRAGKPCVVLFEPPTGYLGLQNSCVTGRGLPFITRLRNSNTIIVRGGVPSKTGPTEVFVTVENPIQYFASVTYEAFVRDGISVKGEIV